MDKHGERLSKLLESLNFNQLSFAKETGVSQTFLSKIMNDDAGISRGVLEKILLRFPEVNAGWLITGIGPMFIAQSVISENVSAPPIDDHFNRKLKIHPIAEELLLKAILIKNLKAAALRWDMYNQELFSLLDPTVGRQAVSKYMLGHSWPGMEAILRFELVTAIPVLDLLTREIAPAELPDKPIEPGHQVAAELAAHLSRANRSLRQFLQSDFYQKLPK